MEGVRVQSHLIELVQTDPFEFRWNGYHLARWNLDVEFLHYIMGVLQAHHALEFIRVLHTEAHTLVSSASMFLKL